MIQFFHVLIENRRLAHLWDIQMIYQKIVDAEENKQMAHVVSAYPLTAEQQNQIATLLKRQTSGVLTLTFSTDPTVLGGFSVRNSNTVIDLTFANQLKSLMHTMKGTA
jgi:F-type H+-transporting ATPase subunit delta